MEERMSQKRRNARADAVGKWDFTLDRDRVRESTREVLIAAQERTKEIRETRLKRVSAA